MTAHVTACRTCYVWINDGKLLGDIAHVYIIALIAVKLCFQIFILGFKVVVFFLRKHLCHLVLCFLIVGILFKHLFDLVSGNTAFHLGLCYHKLIISQSESFQLALKRLCIGSTYFLAKKRHFYHTFIGIYCFLHYLSAVKVKILGDKLLCTAVIHCLFHNIIAKINTRQHGNNCDKSDISVYLFQSLRGNIVAVRQP